MEHHELMSDVPLFFITGVVQADLGLEIFAMLKTNNIKTGRRNIMRWSKILQRWKNSLVWYMFRILLKITFV